MIYASRSEQGLRNRNEDNIAIPGEGDIPLVIVADGMGGHNAGQMASRIAVQTALSEIKLNSEGDTEAALKNAVITANRAVLEYAHNKPECSGMGTTMVMALLSSAHFVAANVGDSRLYHFDGINLVQITIDHSYVQELVAAGYITAQQAKHHPQRNIITRALGTHEIEKVDLFRCKWNEGDILMLCTDGLYEALEVYDIIRVLKEETSLSDACDALVQDAIYGGSTDNISIVLVKNSGG
ncbi:MAG: Stp1/IreP family PP2C-type Ser/Thr phosphatase [Clostridia bacterium]